MRLAFVGGLFLAVLAMHAYAKSDRASEIQFVAEHLGMRYPIDVVVNPPRKDGGGVTGGFMWDANSKMLKWAYDGRLLVVPRNRSNDAIARFLYVGATYPGHREARQLEPGSPQEVALTSALRLFCEDAMPSARYDEFVARIDSLKAPVGVLDSLSEQEHDAFRLWSVVQFLESQASRATAE